MKSLGLWVTVMPAIVTIPAKNKWLIVCDVCFFPLTIMISPMVLDATPGASLVVLLVAAVKKYGS